MAGKYPSWRYHEKHAAVIVKDEEDEARRAPEDEGWTDSPHVDNYPEGEPRAEAKKLEEDREKNPHKAPEYRPSPHRPVTETMKKAKKVKETAVAEDDDDAGADIDLGGGEEAPAPSPKPKKKATGYRR